MSAAPVMLFHEAKQTADHKHAPCHQVNRDTKTRAITQPHLSTDREMTIKFSVCSVTFETFLDNTVYDKSVGNMKKGIKHQPEHPV